MADRLPPGQGALQNWNTPNLNKPEEYSSEFTVDGIKYANVTNVSTGQRQLYFVQSISGARGAPITTTNADGTKTPGGTYDNFNRNNPGKLAAAEAASKQASIKLLSTPGISTPAEAAAIKNSKEFKSTTAGSNVAPGGTAGGTAGDPRDSISAAGTLDTVGAKSKEPLVYPINLAETHQDVIKFSMLQYKASGVGGGERTKPESRIIQTTVLPVPNGISDTNTANWGDNSLNALERAAAAAAMTGIQGGVGAGMEEAGKQIQTALGDGGTKTGFAAFMAAMAVGTNASAILSRATGQVINPNLELLFNAPSLRPFSFTFKLAARSKEEGQTILKILRFFKQGMSPIKTESNLFLKAPNTFKIQYLKGTTDNPNIGRIKECALQSVITSYTPEGQYATFSDGVMVSYSLQLSFTELEPIFNSDYEGLPGIGY